MDERTTWVTSNVSRLDRVAMRAPGAILGADADRWHYAKTIDPEALAAQYKSFAELVAASGAEIVWLSDTEDDLADSIFTYDPSFTVGGGAVVGRPGKPLRNGEIELHRNFYRDHGIPIIGEIEAPGLFEGGDCFWLDDATLAVGRGFRTNQVGIDQLTDLVKPLGVDVLGFDLPYHRGPEACLHLMSVVSPLDVDLALVHPPLMPTPLWEALLDRDYQVLVAPAEEFEQSLGLSLNVLATAPRELIAINGFEGTLAVMRDAGCTVATFDADELCIPCEGGPTCMTRPLRRTG
ncbi:MAG: arginine deiminase family protein [Actinomycetota bacterium]